MPSGTNAVVEVIHRCFVVSGLPHLKYGFKSSCVVPPELSWHTLTKMGNFHQRGSCSWTTLASKQLGFQGLFYLVVYSLLKFKLVRIGLTCALLSFQRENKNRYLFAYLKSLVDCGLFDHIYLNFLPVGHTHCDIDQLFSRVATFLKGMFSSTCLCGNMQKLRSFLFA